jgi:hypothetical protein
LRRSIGSIIAAGVTSADPPRLAPVVLTLPLARAAEETTAALARLDERLHRADPEIAEGALARADMLEAQALVALRGGVSALEDIVLNDAGMDVRAPTGDVTRAVSLVALRRNLVRRGAASAWTPGMVAELAGVDGAGGTWTTAAPGASDAGRFPVADDEADAIEDLAEEPEDEEALDPWPDGDAEPAASPPVSLRATLAAADGLLARSRRPLSSFNPHRPDGPPEIRRVSDPAYDGARRLADWLHSVEAMEVLPAALAAAAALDRWLLLEPSEHRGEAGFLLAAALLGRRGIVHSHLPAPARGYRRGRFRWGPHQPEEERLAGLLAALREGARLGQGDCDRLSIARDVMGRRCLGRSRNSRLPQLVALFIASPIVTTQMAARRLGVSPQAVEGMLKDLGSSLPRELTGRKRYRAWGVL